jgi:hypothetical protein
VRVFCACHGLATASFYHRRRVLERRAAEAPAFVPVQVVADIVPAQASALEVALRDGRPGRRMGLDRRHAACYANLAFMA